jgi:hypothetical protein
MLAARPECGEHFTHRAGASDNESRHPARYGQNDCAIALNRKNALFAGSDEGAGNWAAIASLIETAKLNGINPHAWLTDTLTKLVNRWPASRIDDLMPWAYAIPAI